MSYDTKKEGLQMGWQFMKKASPEAERVNTGGQAQGKAVGDKMTTPVHPRNKIILFI